jgi:hypothetical protein
VILAVRRLADWQSNLLILCAVEVGQIADLPVNKNARKRQWQIGNLPHGQWQIGNLPHG